MAVTNCATINGGKVVKAVLKAVNVFLALPGEFRLFLTSVIPSESFVGYGWGVSDGFACAERFFADLRRGRILLSNSSAPGVSDQGLVQVAKIKPASTPRSTPMPSLSRSPLGVAPLHIGHPEEQHDADHGEENAVNGSARLAASSFSRLRWRLGSSRSGLSSAGGDCSPAGCHWTDRQPSASSTTANERLQVVQ